MRLSNGPAFSEVGDSGSCVFDIGGRIAGIVDAGTLDGNDITYVTPIDWIIKDLQEKYYSVRLL